MATEIARPRFRISRYRHISGKKKERDLPAPSEPDLVPWPREAGRGSGRGAFRYGTVTEKSVTSRPTPPLQISNPAKTLVRYHEFCTYPRVTASWMKSPRL